MRHEYETLMTKEKVELLHGVEHRDKLARPFRILEAMAWGIEAKISHMKYRLAESKEGGLVVVSFVDDDCVLGHPDLSITRFSEMVSKNMTDKEFDELMVNYACSKAITGWNSRKKRRNVGELEQ